jgi:iron-sulfur cluster assembly protein
MIVNQGLRNGEERMVHLTETAVAEIKKIFAKENNPDLALRVGVKGGGCAGLEYNLSFDANRQEWDEEFVENGVKILVDSKSHLYLNGTTIDFSKALTGGGFKFNNPNATGGCGCGTSFAV